MPAIIWAGCIYVASSIPSGSIQWWILHRLDKAVHLTIFFIFGLLVYRALHRGNGPSQFSYKRVFLMLVIVLGYGLFDELHQANTPGRSVDLRDLLADMAGGILAGGTAIVTNVINNRRARARGNLH